MIQMGLEGWVTAFSRSGGCCARWLQDASAPCLFLGQMGWAACAVCVPPPDGCATVVSHATPYANKMTLGGICTFFGQ